MNQNQDSKSRKPKTILILSIITSLFMGVMGYEIATKATAKSKSENHIQKFAILAKQPIISSNEKKQYASMNAQNQYLTNKVISLKEHSLELSRRLNVVQLSVFAARKSHDQTIIEEIQAQLEEKEVLNSQLQTDCVTLQQNLSAQEILSMNMESTIDHLSEMVELQRQGKEKAIEGLRSNLEVAATTERNRLMNVIQDLEGHQSQLKSDLEKQSSEIARLEENLSQYKFFASENEEALIFAVQQHEEKQKELYAQAEILATRLNLEEIAAQSLLNEISAFEEIERHQTLALQQELELNTMQRIHESMIHDDLSRLLESDVTSKQAELDIALANLNAAETQINAQRIDIALLKEQRAEREQELIQEQEVLLADLVQKQENLSIALSKFNSSEISLGEQSQEIENLKDQIAKHEVDLAQIRTIASEQLQLNDLLAAEMLEKQDELNASLIKFDLADMSLIEQHQELIALKDEIAKCEQELTEVRDIATEQMKANQQLIAEMSQKQEELTGSVDQYVQAKETLDEQQQQIAVLKNQMEQRELEFTQMNAILLADIAQKEENLALALEKSNNSEINIKDQTQEITALKEQIVQKEQDITQAREFFAAEMSSKEQFIVEINSKQEELATVASQLAQQEISILKEHMAQREQELLQTNEALLADIAQKEENLSLALAKLDSSAVNLNEQTQEIATLSEQIAQREQELAQVREMVSSEMKNNQQLIAEMTQKREELSLALAKFDQSELDIAQKQQEIVALKDQMSQREQELLQANESLLADIAQKEENLSSVLAKFDSSELNLSEQTEEIANLKEQIAQQEQDLAQIRESASLEMQNNQQLIADMILKQEELADQTMQLAQQEIAALKDQMSQREQELLQANESLLADIAQKEENLSSVLAKFDSSELNLSEQTEEIANLKEQIAQHEQELALVRENAVEEMQNNQQIVANLLQKQEELTDTIAQFHNLEEQIQSQHQSIIVQKEQMIQREQELMQVNETLLAEIAQKEETLALTLVKVESSEISIKEQNQAIAALSEQIQLHEQELVKARESTVDEQKMHQQLIAELSEKQDLLASTMKQLTQAEANIDEQLQAITGLKDQMIEREQELTQVNAALVADIVQKEESLSLALARFNSSEISINEQNQAIATLTVQIADRDQEISQIREIALEDAKAHQQLIADMVQKEKDLTVALAQKNHAEISLTQQHQEIVTLKEQMAEIEHSYQENLNAVLMKKEESDILLNNKIDQLQALNEQLESTKEAASTSALAKTELSNELKNLQQELVTAFGKIEEIDNVARNQKQEIEMLSSQLEETKQTMTAADSQKSVLMEEIINYKNALVNALTNYENEQKRATTLEQQLSTYLKPGTEQESTSSGENTEEEDLRSLINQEGFEDQAALEVPLLG